MGIEEDSSGVGNVVSNGVVHEIDDRLQCTNRLRKNPG